MLQKCRQYCWLLAPLVVAFMAGMMSFGFAQQDRNAGGAEAPGSSRVGAGLRVAGVTPDGFMTLAPESQTLTAKQSTQRIRQVMRQRIDFHLQDHSLTGFAKSLQDSLGVAVTLDTQEFEFMGLDPETTFLSCSYTEVQIDTVLRDLLPTIDCGYYIDGNMVVITSHERADCELLTIVYDCEDLLLAEQERLDAMRPLEDEDDPDMEDNADTCNSQICFTGSNISQIQPKAPWEHTPEDNLLEIITSTTGTTGDNGWLDEGTGAGTLGFYAGNLVVSQTLEVHDEIEDLLALIREALATRQ